MIQVENYRVSSDKKTMAQIEAANAAIFAAIASGNRGPDAPLNPFPGMDWIDTSTENMDLLKKYTTEKGWVPFLVINRSTGKASLHSDVLASLGFGDLAFLDLIGSSLIENGAITSEKLNPNGISLPAGSESSTPASGVSSKKIPTMESFFQGINGSTNPILGKATAAGGSRILFNNLSADCDEYVASLFGVTPIASGVPFVLRFSSDNGESFINSNYSHCGWGMTDVNTYGYQYNGSDSAISITGSDVISTDPGSGLHGEVRFFGLTTAGAEKRCTFVGNMKNGNSRLFKISSGQWWGGNLAINAIQFFFPYGNIASGQIILSGKRSS